MSTRAAMNPRCYNHPHRDAARRCDRCGVPYCEECLATVESQTRLCPTCCEEVAEARCYRKAMHLGVPARVTRVILKTLLAVVVIVGIILGMFYLVYLIAPPALMR